MTHHQPLPHTLARHRQEITDDLAKLLDIFPPPLREQLAHHPQQQDLIEVVMDLGRIPEARFADRAVDLGKIPVSKEDLQHCLARVGQFSGDNRAGIERTLHRISAIRNRNQEVIGLTCRIGRAVFGTILMIQDLIETGKSILLLGRPGVGKTTALREIARVLADDFGKRVVIIDTSNEIAGDGDVPHPAIGRARRMQVSQPELQHKVMIEAVENHMPEVIVIDEIGTELEALAARTIAERGVQLVGTAHGNQLENLIKNPTLSDLVGGIQAVTLGDDEARRRGSQKTVLERKALPTFEIAVEMHERQRWIIHDDVATTIDTLLRGHDPLLEERRVDDGGEVTREEVRPEIPERFGWPQSPESRSPEKPKGWRASGQMSPVGDFSRSKKKEPSSPLDLLLDQSWHHEDKTTEKIRVPGPNGEDWPLYVYPYGLGKSQLDQVQEVLRLPVVFTKDLDQADAVLALRSQIKHHSRLRQLAKTRHLPIQAIKANTIPQITRGLRRLLSFDDPANQNNPDLQLFIQGNSHDEMEALEEARLAVEQIVIPKGQPVELLPRSAKVRKMQHELVEHYRLSSSSFGDEPNRRLRIYPA